MKLLGRTFISLLLTILLGCPILAADTPEEIRHDVFSHFRKGGFYSAMRRCSEGVRQYPLDVRLNGLMLDFYEDEGNLRPAIDQAERMIQLEPREAVHYHNMWCLMFTKGDLASAEHYIRRALSKNEENPRLPDILRYESRLSLALTLYRQGRIQEAQDAVEQAIQIKLRTLNDDKAYLAAGDILLRRGSYAQALVPFKALVERMSVEDRYPLYLYLGTAQLLAGQLEEARVSFQKASEQDPAYAKAKAKYGLRLAQRWLVRARREIGARSSDSGGETGSAQVAGLKADKDSSQNIVSALLGKPLVFLQPPWPRHVFRTDREKPPGPGIFP